MLVSPPHTPPLVPRRHLFVLLHIYYKRLCRGYRGVLDGERMPEPEERSVRSRMFPGGMVKLELVLEPDEADLILRAVERAREVQAQEERAQQAAPLKQEAPSALARLTPWAKRRRRKPPAFPRKRPGRRGLTAR